ncbi:MAG: hypothetical protein QNJ60_16955 [Xenococcaceae cyanobacterium MO_188.B19]|nr:hypothetical protein [Xenococcaceae cyanobacterium MO_188.B19]
MKQVNYAAMSDQELKHYMLTHRKDEAALNAYLDRRRERPKKVTVEFEDPAWEEKILSIIKEKIDNKTNN